MNITLKNVKVIKSMSRETLCYTATIYVDGFKAGTCENDGSGGCARSSVDPEYRHIVFVEYDVPGHERKMCFGDYCDWLAGEEGQAKEAKKALDKFAKMGCNFAVKTETHFIGLKEDNEDGVRKIVEKNHPDVKILEIIKL